MKKMKTGETVKFPKKSCAVFFCDRWMTIYPHTLKHLGMWSRDQARNFKVDGWPNQRIARILSIGPKYVTVRISK